MKNMAVPESTLPIKADCQLKNLKAGRKLGADPIFSKKQARFITKKVICPELVLRDEGAGPESRPSSYLVAHGDERGYLVQVSKERNLCD